MKVLLDTNIIIYRENAAPINESIMILYRWLDKLKYEKKVHPYTLDELRKFHDEKDIRSFELKVQSYSVLRTTINPPKELLDKLKCFSKKDNDYVDHAMLYEVYMNRVDFLITEDRKMIRKAETLGIDNKVYTIGQFVTKCTEENPDLIDYSELKVKKEVMGSIDINDPFFDTLKKDYERFEEWFHSKCDDDVYVSYDDKNKLQGFLSLKREDEHENYSHIVPILPPKKRLKIRTFKVNSTGFRLGERFLKIAFDHALLYNVEEIYVTMFDNDRLRTLKNFMITWGFVIHGINSKTNEVVLIKTMKYKIENNVVENFPLFDKSRNKFFLPIEPDYHRALFADSTIQREPDYGIEDQIASRYAIKKVYISWAYTAYQAKPGDIILIYRKGEYGTKKIYTSTITSICIVDEIKLDFTKEDEFINYCENRSVFSIEMLRKFWKKASNISVIKLLYLKPLEKNLILNDLVDMGMYNYNEGPRPFDSISDEQFHEILGISNTTI